MKLDFLNADGGACVGGRIARVTGETRRLRHVLLASPAGLEAVPCCAATRHSLREGFTACRETALGQHRVLRETLEAAGVAVDLVPPARDAPDLCFARDGLVTTPWGLVALNPALPHRARELSHLVARVAALGLRPVDRITAGPIEGGDICIARPGLLVIGCSDERTDAAGAEALAAPFRRHGWDVLICPLDPHFLHLDTVFCMLDAGTALACADVLDDGFLAALAARGIRVLPVRYKESRALACNILSIDGRRIVMAAGQARVEAMLRAEGFAPLPVDVSQFAACGGGIHCLTMPLLRD